MLKSYRDLLVWQKAIELVVRIYRFSAQFPSDEIYGLTAQLRRASVSVPSNIAEGYGRGSRREYIHFLLIAQGSIKELETQVILAEKLDYSTAVATAEVLERSEEVGKMLGGLIRALKQPST